MGALQDLQAIATTISDGVAAAVTAIDALIDALPAADAVPAGDVVAVVQTLTTAAATLSAAVASITPKPAEGPAVSGVNPNIGAVAGGESVVVTGSGFTGATAVDFGTGAATSFTVDSDTQITAVAPASAAGQVDVTVTSPLGTSAVTAADAFTSS